MMGGMGDLGSVLLTISVWALPVLIAITLHEAAHAFVADRLGDPTARQEGRVSMNPLRHVDPIGTVLLPLLLVLTRAPILLGWAKPVPVVAGRLRNPRRDMMLVAAAGPAMNLAIAFACLVALRFLPGGMADGSASVGSWVVQNLGHGVLLNVLLAVFNMLPILPLDGGRVLLGLLPRPMAARFAQTERYGFLIVLAAILLLPWLGRSLGIDLDLFARLVLGPTRWLIEGMSALVA